jgi:hypothetical protein
LQHHDLEHEYDIYRLSAGRTLAFVRVDLREIGAEEFPIDVRVEFLKRFTELRKLNVAVPSLETPDLAPD